MFLLTIATITGSLGAFFYRARGGFNPLDKGTQLARLCFWSAPCGLAVLILAIVNDLTLGSALFYGFFAMIFAHISLLEDHGPYINNDPPIQDALAMAQICFMRGLAIGAPAAIFAPLMILLPFFGALGGLGYWLGWRFLGNTDSGIHWWGRVCAVGGSDWGELFTGFFIFFGFGLLGAL